MKTDTDVKNNMIAHYCDPAENSDKIYITCVRKNKNGEWEFVGKWGKRGSKLKEMIYETCSRHPATDLKRFMETAKVNTVSASTTNIESASSGKRAKREK